MNLSYYLKKVKDVKLEDYVAFFPMLIGWIASPIFRKRNKDVWVICDRKDEARDNGYFFFKYLCSVHKEVRCIYVIDKKCNDYQKVKDLGEIVQYGSIRHWILYFSSRWLISSQSNKPNGYLCTLIERLGLYKPDHVFLQHGITKDVAEFLLASHRLVKYFIAGAQPEYEFIKEKFGYKEDTVQYTGFARFDSLHSYCVKNNRILIMPTWRKWLRFKSETHEDATFDINSSDYIACWKALLKSKELDDIINRYNLEVIFYPHPNMKGILKPAKLVSDKISIVNSEKEDLQSLLKTSSILITDYSSVFFDMAYMKKPIIFYQFDEEKYRKYHYQRGWFDYSKTSFGVVCKEKNAVIDSLNEILETGFNPSPEYDREHASVFPLYDSNNCERIYNLLMKDDK